MLTEDKYSVTSELAFSAGIDSSNFDVEKEPLKESLYGILKKEAPFLKISDVKVTFKEELEFPPPSRTQTSTVSILVLTIGPFDEDKAEGIKDVVNSNSFFDNFEKEIANPQLVLEDISNISKYKLWCFIIKIPKPIIEIIIVRPN